MFSFYFLCMSSLYAKNLLKYFFECLEENEHLGESVIRNLKERIFDITCSLFSLTFCLVYIVSLLKNGLGAHITNYTATTIDEFKEKREKIKQKKELKRKEKLQKELEKLNTKSDK